MFPPCPTPGVLHWPSRLSLGGQASGGHAGLRDAPPTRFRRAHGSESDS